MAYTPWVDPTQNEEVDDSQPFIHRVRFVDWSPSSISSIAITPDTWDPSSSFAVNSREQGGRGILAVGRANGNIELFGWIGGVSGSGSGKRSENFGGNGKGKGKGKLEGLAAGEKQGWVLLKTLPGPIPSNPEHLVFSHQTVLSPSDISLLDDPNDPNEIAREESKLLKTPPRLFSTAGGSELLEWSWLSPKGDHEVGHVKRSLPSNGGSIWSVAVNPRGTTLAIGCEDGCVRLISLWDDEFEHLRRLDAVKCRLLSLAWGPLEEVRKGKRRDEEVMDVDGEEEEGESHGRREYEDAYLVAGCSDSSLRKWDVRSGRSVFRMTTDKVRGEHTLVWAVGVLSDHTVISGDSMGNVKTWDGTMGTQLQSFNKAHGADVLCLAISPDGRSIYTSGVDQKTNQYRLTGASEKASSRSPAAAGKWVLSATRRLHAHDVRSIVVSPPYHHPTPSGHREPKRQRHQLPILISGGLDMSLILLPASLDLTRTPPPNPISESKSTSFSDATQRKVSYVPQRASSDGTVQVSKGGRLVICMREKSLGVWRIPEKIPGLGGEAEGMEVGGRNELDGKEQGGWVKVLEMDLKTSTNLTCSAISYDGKWLAVGSASEVKVWRLEGKGDDIQPRRQGSVVEAISSTKSLSDDAGASHLAFTPDSARLVVVTARKGRLAVVSLGDSTVLKVFDPKDLPNALTKGGKSMAGGAKAQPNGRSHDGESSEDEGEAEDTPATSVPTNSVQDRTCVCIAISGDGQWLATADLSRRLRIYNLDALRHHSDLPSVQYAPTVLVFADSSPSTLIVGLPNNTIQAFDVDSGRIPTWAREMSINPPRSLTRFREPLVGIAFNPVTRGERRFVRGNPARGEETMIVWGSTWLSKVNLSGVLWKGEGGGVRSEGVGGKKRLHEDEDEDEDDGAEAGGKAVPGEDPEEARGRFARVRTTHKYQPLICVEYLSPGELVAVERPFLDLLEQLPDAWVRTGKYGT